MTHTCMHGRRHFVQRAGALAALGLSSRFSVYDVVTSAEAQTVSDYRALVCVFLYGGNDGNNTVIPLDAAGYAQYAAVRPASSGIQLAQGSLLPIQPISAARPYGLHASLTELQALFDQRRLAIVANVGTLVQPITRTQYVNGTVPLSLYSHSDQVAQWQSSVSNTVSGTGWGGRIADKMASQNAGTAFPVVTSLNGAVLFATGKSTSPLSIPVSGSFALAGYNNSAASVARRAALEQFLAAGSPNQLVKAANGIGAQAITLSATMSPIVANANSSVAPLFAPLTGNSTASALLQVAKTIEARAVTGARRQVFFVGLGGFDTHGGQAATQANLLGQLSPALKAFYDATVALGVASQVTTFTLSDFGRTLQPASGGGTDHAWGNHHFVLGDAVKGGDMFGQYPTLALGGPNDAEQRGRWIPTISVDQYGATLARWFGVSEADLASVFPSLSKFPTSDIGFMT
ncbi:MAG: DUF1501 domain-containing protein [Burkholderiales bacterium]